MLLAPADSLIESLLHSIGARTGARGVALKCAQGISFAWPTQAIGLERASHTYAIDARTSLLLIGSASSPSEADLDLAIAAVAIIAENTALRCEVERLACEVRATFEVTRQICSLTDLDQLLLLVAEKSRELLGCELAGFALLDERGGTITWKAMSGCRTDVFRRHVFRHDAGLAGRAISSRAPVVIQDFLDPSFEPEEFPISFAEGLRSVVGVPLEIAGTARGCLMIGYRSLHTYTDEEIKLLTSFAAQAAIAIETAQLYEELRRERARLESIVQSVNEGIVLIDRADRIAYVNRRAEEVFGLTRERCVGLDLDAFLDEIITKLIAPARARADLLGIRGNVVGFPSFDIVLSREQTSTFRITLFAVHDERGAEFGRGYLCRDVTLEKQVDAIKSEIISIVSHELRTPLASIRGYASALLDRGRRRDPGLQREYLRIIDEESTRLGDLVTNLLDVSRLDAGVLEMDHHPFDLNALVAARIRRWKDSQPAYLFVCEALAGGATVELDHVRIEQVVDNLINNAVGSAAPGTSVCVRVERVGNDVVVCVSDEGPGIAPEEFERIFERFHRVATGESHHLGSGLGLYICRGIVNAHGGRMWVDSRRGSGATFFFSLPAPLEVSGEA